MGTPVECPRCEPSKIVTKSGYKVCESCGLIINETPVSKEEEWRAFDIKQLQKKRRSSTTKEIVKEYAQVWEGEKDSLHSNSPQREKLRNIEQEIKKITDTLNLSTNIQQTAEVILLKYLSKKNIRSKKKPYFVCAALYISARKRGRPIPFDRFGETTEIKKSDIVKVYRKIREVLSLKVTPPKPEEYIISFGKELSLSFTCIKLAKKIIKKAREKNLLIGKTSSGLAAASIYFASKITREERKRKKIAETAAVSGVTMISRYKELKRNLKKFLQKSNRKIQE